MVITIGYDWFNNLINIIFYIIVLLFNKIVFSEWRLDYFPSCIRSNTSMYTWYPLVKCENHFKCPMNCKFHLFKNDNHRLDKLVKIEKLKNWGKLINSEFFQKKKNLIFILFFINSIIQKKQF